METFNTIVSTIKGTNDQIKENLIGSGNNAVVVSLHQGDGQLDLSWQQAPDGVRVISEETRRDIEDIKEIYIKGLEFKYVATVSEVLNFVFE